MDESRIDRTQIVQEALLLLEEDGIEKLSMRRLAARLDVRAPTLYWYFPDRSSILREVLRSLIADVVARVRPASSWQEWLRGFGHALWRGNCEAPFATLLLQSAELNDASVVQAAMKMVEEQCERYDVDRTIFFRAHSDIQALVLGWSVYRHSGVTSLLGSYFDVDQAVLDGIDAIVRAWEERAAAVLNGNP